MTQTVTGKVESKARNGKGIKVDGVWYNSPTSSMLNAVSWNGRGFTPEVVTLEVEDKKIISVGSDAPAAAAPAAKQGSFEDRQTVIVWQSARNAAIEFVKAAYAAEAVPLPTNKADRLDAFMDLVDRYTKVFHLDAMEVYDGKEVELDDAPVNTEEAE